MPRSICQTLFYLGSIFVLLTISTACRDEPLPSTQEVSGITNLQVTNVVSATLPATLRPTKSATPSVSKTLTQTSYPSATPQLILTSTPTHFSASTAAETVSLLPISTLALEPKITSTPLPNIVWDENIQAITLLRGKNVVWSPVNNNLAIDLCSAQNYEYGDLSAKPVVDLAFPPQFLPLEIETPDIHCTVYSKIIWQPDGGRIGFSAVPDELPYMPTYGEGAFVHLVDHDGANFENTNLPLDFENFYGWMGNEKLVTSNYFGGGHAIVRIDDIETKENLAWGFSYALSVPLITPNYVVKENWPIQNVELALFSTRQIRPVDEEKGNYQYPFSNFLSVDEDTWELAFNSHFQDSFDDFSKLLVLTWDEGVNYFEDEKDVLMQRDIFNLQVWDLDTDRLEMLVPNAIYGRISPDDRYLVFVTPSPDMPQIKILDLFSKETVFEAEVLAKVENAFSIVEADVSFSPDGRYTTYFDVNSNLVVVDLVQLMVVAQIPAYLESPVWSPNSQILTFKDPTENIQLLDISNNRVRPLVENEYQSRLSNPQWSFDGTYLSVAINDGNQNWETAILTIK